MDEEKGHKIVFDIVNSVKGGSGKSTVALQLAAFWASQTNTDAYIIDLDLRGSSWQKTYEHDYNPADKNNLYINDLMYGFGPEDSIFWHLAVQCTNAVMNVVYPSNVRLCIGDPSVTGDIDALKVDLLESAVCDIIDRIIAKSEAQNEVHIILDMPPSYESHAERVIKHLLMDKNSNLFKRQYKDGKSGYYINLLMIYAITASHVDQNIVYLNNFFKQAGFSSALNTFIQNNTFSVFFIGNDVSGVAGTGNEKMDNDIKITARVKYLLKTAITFNNSLDMMKGLQEKLLVIEHMQLSRNLQFFTDPEKPITPKLMDEAKRVFEELFLHKEQSMTI